MPPSTRSQTTRSRPPNPGSVATLEDELRNLDVGSDAARPDRSSSSEEDPADESHEATGQAIRTTPRTRRITKTIDSTHRMLVRAADPNQGRCLLTNRPTAIELCHVIANATGSTTLSKLEYVWEIKRQKFNLMTRRNLFHLRADWHYLFDKSQWILVPEPKTVEELKNTYLTDGRLTSNLTMKFENQPFFKYYVVPAPSLQEVICRFPNINKFDHDTHIPPFSGLGPLSSHVFPHYVIFNTGQKLSNIFSRREVAKMRQFLSQSLSATFEDESLLDYIEDLYTKWMKTEVPAEWRGNYAPSNPSHPSGGEGQGGASQGPPPQRRQGLRSTTRSQGQGSQASGGQYYRGQQRAVLPCQPSEDDDTSSVTDDTVVEDDTAWIEYIHKWQKEGEVATGGLDEDVVDPSCDEQLTAYINEHARTPPSPGAWDSWHTTWDNRKSFCPNESDRSRFSSNDWAVFKNDVYLTKSEHPELCSISLSPFPRIDN